MKIFRSFLAITISIFPFAVFAQQLSPADTLLNHLTGKWVLKGTIAGKNIVHDISAEWVLGHEYIELKETARDKRPDGQPSYEAIVYISFKKKMKQYDCLWLDNTETTDYNPNAIAHATPKTDTIALIFKFSVKSIFYTTFNFIPNKNTWHWNMADEENGKIELFADGQMIKE